MGASPAARLAARAARVPVSEVRGNRRTGHGDRHALTARAGNVADRDLAVLICADAIEPPTAPKPPSVASTTTNATATSIAASERRPFAEMIRRTRPPVLASTDPRVRRETPPAPPAAGAQLWTTGRPSARGAGSSASTCASLTPRCRCSPTEWGCLQERRPDSSGNPYRASSRKRSERLRLTPTAWPGNPHRRCGVGEATRKSAAGVGFEPTGRLHAQRFSRPPDSTALAPRRESTSVGGPTRISAAQSRGLLGEFRANMRS